MLLKVCDRAAMESILAYTKKVRKIFDPKTCVEFRTCSDSKNKSLKIFSKFKIGAIP